jgi:hypothetical protein
MNDEEFWKTINEKYQDDDIAGTLAFDYENSVYFEMGFITYEDILKMIDEEIEKRKKEKPEKPLAIKKRPSFDTDSDVETIEVYEPPCDSDWY